MRKVAVKGPRGSIKIAKEEPSEITVYAVLFAIIGLICLTTLQIAHLIITESWSSEIFSAITGLIGLVLGIFFGRGGEGPLR